MKRILILLTLIIVGKAIAQEKKSTLDRSNMMDFTNDVVFGKSMEDRANKYYNILNFDKAIELYKRADTLTIQGVRNYADACVKQNKASDALLVYGIVINRKDVQPSDYFQYANLLKMNSRYTEADVWMKKYAEKAPDELRTIHNKRVFNECATLRQDRGFFQKVNLGINTPKQEFASSFVNGTLVYSAQGEEQAPVIKKYTWTKESFLNLYVVDTVLAQDTAKRNLSPLFNDKFHEGSSTFTGDGKKVFFSANDPDLHADSSKTYNLQLYSATLNSDSTWSEKVPFEYNSPNYSIAHPWINKSGNLMYFSSNMPGGKGGADIYVTTLDKNGVWSNPKNLGDAINTEGDEFFPFYNDKDSIFSFASNGHFGLGGLDIIMCKFRENEFVQVTNFGTPLNSESDDFAAVFTDDMKVGYISSNREGGQGSDDIYGMKILKPLQFDIEMKEIKVITKFVDTTSLPGVSIELINLETQEVTRVQTNESGYYSFSLPAGQTYKVRGQFKFYNADSTTFSTDFKAVGKDVTINLKKKGPDVVTVDDQIFLKVSTIYFDVNSANLREDTKDVLDYVVKIMHEYPNIEIELGSHTDCRGSITSNQKLADQRAINSAAYIKERIDNPNRIHGKGYGETQTTNGCDCEGKVKSTCSESEHQANRRTEFKIVKGH